MLACSTAAHCGGIAEFDGGTGVGHLLLVRRGPLGVIDTLGRHSVVSEPSVLFFPRAGAHRLDGGEREGADVVCASIDFGVSDENPLTARAAGPAERASGPAARPRPCSAAAVQRGTGQRVVDTARWWIASAEVLVIQLLAPRHGAPTWWTAESWPAWPIPAWPRPSTPCMPTPRGTWTLQA